MPAARQPINHNLAFLVNSLRVMVTQVPYTCCFGYMKGSIFIKNKAAGILETIRNDIYTVSFAIGFFIWLTQPLAGATIGDL